MRRWSVGPLLLVGSALLLAGCAGTSEGADDLVVAVDTVRGHEPSDHGPTCAVNSQWHRGEMIVWRARVYDAETGDQVPANASELMESAPSEEEVAEMVEGVTVTVTLGDGQTFPMHFGGHGGENPVDYFWTVSWIIPEDYPTGTIETSVTAEWPDKEKSGNWDQFAVGSSFAMVLE